MVLDQWEPGKPFYTICRAYHLSGRLDASLMEESLNGVVVRHEILRTTFHLSKTEPTQVIAPFLSIKLDLLDYRVWRKVMQKNKACFWLTNRRDDPLI